MHIVISGHYGGINIGDDAIIIALVNSIYKFGSQDIKITTISHNPTISELQTKSPSIQHITLSPFSFLKKLKIMIKTIRKADMVVIGGGGLLQDEFSIKTVPRFLLPAFLAKVYGKPTVFHALGVGPINTYYSKRLIKLIGSHIDRITVRDTESKKLLLEIGLTKVEVVPDPAFLLSACEEGRTRKILQQESLSFPARRSRIGVSLRGFYHTNKRKINSLQMLTSKNKDILVQELERIGNHLNARLVFVCTDQTMDRKITEEIESRCSCPSQLIQGSYQPPEFAGILKSMDAVISFPFHSALIAASNRVPVLAINYNPKVQNLMRRLGLKDYLLSVKELTDLSSRFFDLWHHREMIEKHLGKEIPKIKDQESEEVRRILTENLQNKHINYASMLYILAFMLFGFFPEYFYRYER
jgi:polysaccharide pyruvyl transferase CsaB